MLRILFLLVTLFSKNASAIDYFQTECTDRFGNTVFWQGIFADELQLRDKKGEYHIFYNDVVDVRYFNVKQLDYCEINSENTTVAFTADLVVEKDNRSAFNKNLIDLQRKGTLIVIKARCEYYDTYGMGCDKTWPFKR